MGMEISAGTDGQAGTRGGGAGSSGDVGTDFVWRFRLDEKPASTSLAHPLDELLRVQWEELLKLTVPLYKGQPVKVDGFATMRDPERALPVFSDDPQLARSKPAPL